jgi:hypothetical protein
MYDFARYSPGQKATGFGISAAFTFGRRDLAICRVVCRSAMQTQGNRTVRKIVAVIINSAL